MNGTPRYAAGFRVILEHLDHAWPIDPQLHVHARVGIGQVDHPLEQVRLFGEGGDKFAGRDEQSAPLTPRDQSSQRPRFN